MGTIGFADLDETVQALRLRMMLGERLVFLLGAGCSMQYGLPGFRQLLEHLGAALGRPRYLPSQRMEAIREDLERVWLSHLTPSDRREQLRKVLKTRSGHDCSGYVRLARLAKKGHVEAFVTMNFDELLEEALASEKVPYRVTNSFSLRSSDKVRVIKPHGSIGRLDTRSAADLILDLAKSDLFTSEKERDCAQRLFSAHDTVVLGYSGVDQKMADVLRPAKREEPKKLFIVNVTPPDRRLLLAAEQRDPYYFLTIGEEANFENFVEELDHALSSPRPESDSVMPRRSIPKIEEFDLMTRAEREAFSHCVDLATRIWWSSGAAGEGSELRGSVGPVAILKHAREVFDLAARLASASGLWLSSPEKYLLRCAGLLHDLGFFSLLQREPARAIDLRGARTADLLGERLRREEPLKLSLTPVSYRSDVCEELITCLLRFCRLNEDTPALEDFSVDEISTPVRPKLLNILFVVAERLSREHAFLPLQETSHDHPEMDLFQRWRQGDICVEIEPRRLTARGPMKEKEASWFLLSCRGLIEDLERVTKKYDGFSLALDDWPAAGMDPQEVLRAALEQALARRIASVEPASPGELTSLLDLVALFSLDARSAVRISPETSPSVSAVLARVKRGVNQKPSEAPLLACYLDLRRKGPKGKFDSLFVRSFEEILYPAWRYLAGRWRQNIEPIITAELSLELGSSRFRSEVIPGLNQLLRERVDWQGDLASGHEGCTQCTSRLLSIFGHAMLLFPRGRIRDLVRDASGHTVEDAIRGMLLHFLAREPDEVSWWGLGGEYQGRITSPEYIAYAAWAAILSLRVDRELKRATGELWLRDSLGIEGGHVEKLARERTVALLQLTAEEILLGDQEEPVYRTVGMVGRLVLNLLAQPRDLMGNILSEGAEQKLMELAGTMKDVKYQIGPLGTLSRLYLWPIDVLLDKLGGDESGDAKKGLAATFMESFSSPLWVARGRAAGSWSFDDQNTYVIASSLTTFWRHALAAENREAFAKVFECLEEPLRNA